MVWLAGQVFLLCLVSFLAGAAITAVALWRKPAERAEDKALEESSSVQEPDKPELAEESASEPVVVKASKKSMRYHTPDSPYYDRVSGSLTFISPQEAELAGYTAWNAGKAPAKAQ